MQWASIVALNGWVNSGTNYTPPVHMIEHALSAHHDITHGAGLAVVNPAYMRFIAKARPSACTKGRYHHGTGVRPVAVTASAAH